MRKTVLVFLLSALFFGVWQMDTYAISAESYCVIEAKGGQILYEKNAKMRRGMASTTKIMTALVAIESGRLDEIAVVSSKAAHTEGSSLYLKVGEKVLVRDLVYGLMLNSGNDAAVVIAEHIGGSVEGFVSLMNQKAKSMRLKDTNFANPNGLSDDAHYTTATELAMITVHALENPCFSEIVATKNKVIETVDTKRKIYLNNHNKLLSILDGCDGVKTGYTKATGRCLVSSASRNGFQIVCVTLNAPDDWKDHENLISKTFADYEKRILLENGTVAGRFNVTDGEQNEVLGVIASDVEGVFKVGSALKIDVEYIVDHTLIAPIERGQKIADAYVYVDGKQYDIVDVIAEKAVSKTQLLQYKYIFYTLIRNVFQF